MADGERLDALGSKIVSQGGSRSTNAVRPGDRGCMIRKSEWNSPEQETRCQV